LSVRSGLSLRPGAALLAAFILAGLLIRVVDTRATLPLSNLFLKTAYAPFFAVRNWALEQVSLRGENARLRHLLAETAWLAQQGEQHAREAGRLRALLELPVGTDRQVYVAQVVGWDRRGGHEEVIVDRGQASGLSQYTPAITEQGVAGRVRLVTADFARVQLITDPACRVAVRSARAGVLGVARMGGNGQLIMDHVGVESDVKTGDTLVTAGIGGIFPAGLHVGTVTRTQRMEKTLLLNVEVKSSAQLDRLDYLFFLESDAPLPDGAPYDVEGQDGTP
jgi:rod shape-determining protein MreC